MKFTIKQTESYAVLSLQEKQLNSMCAPELKSQIHKIVNEGCCNIVLDLKEVDFVDSSGLSGILLGHRACREAGGLFFLAESQAFVMRLITISKLNDQLDMADTVLDAQDLIMKNELRKEIEGNGQGDN